MTPRARAKDRTAKVPGSLGLDYLHDIAKPDKPEAKSSGSDDLESASSDDVASENPEEGSAKRQPSRASKHHVSLYVTPAVDRAMKRIALDEECKAWEIYHEALRQYLDRKGQSFDDLMRGG